MPPRKLLTRLLIALLFTAGFGAGVLPASAQLGTTTPAAPVTTPTAPATTPDPVPAPAAVTTPPAPVDTTPAATAPVEAAPAATVPQATAVPETPPTATTQTTPAITTVREQQLPGTTQKKKKKKKPKATQQKAAADQPAADDTPATAPPADGTPATDAGLADLLPGPAPVGVPNFFIEKFRIPPFLLPIYQAAGIQYGIRWELLAAINEIETDYGRNLNVSSAGALGWMQFMPATWAQYGVDANQDGEKDPFNPVDAIFTAARYLKAAEADKDVRRGIFAYNHADWYVASVLLRARLIGGMPSDLVSSLTGLTQGHFPVHAQATYTDALDARAARRKVAKGTNAAMPVESSSTRKGIEIFAAAGSPVIATQDGRIVGKGRTKRLGNYIRLRDVYGNTYTYARLESVARAYPVPKPQRVSSAAVKAELDLPRRDPRPTRAASAGEQPALTRTVTKRARRTARSKTAAATKERVFANPQRPAAFHAGGEEQILGAELDSGTTTFKSYFTEVFGLDREDVDIKRLEVGSKVIAGTILGQMGRLTRRAPHMLFEIRPAGAGAPRIDPKPILDGWKLLESTSVYRAGGKNTLLGEGDSASIGQLLLMSKEALARRVLADPRIDMYSCGRDDIRAGAIDRRVLATLEFLAASGLEPTVSALECGHGYYTTSGNVSEHSSGSAVDIAAINGIPIIGHQGPGSITDLTIRRLLTLQGTMKPHQIISLMTFDGADNTLSMPDHADHIHVGFHPLDGSSDKATRNLESALDPSQWSKLMDRLGQIDNPTVRTSPSKYSVAVKERASDAHAGE